MKEVPLTAMLKINGNNHNYIQLKNNEYSRNANSKVMETANSILLL